jgi:hypothetical protein
MAKSWASRIGLRLGQEIKNITLADNRSRGFATDMRDLRFSRLSARDDPASSRYGRFLVLTMQPSPWGSSDSETTAVPWSVAGESGLWFQAS